MLEPAPRVRWFHSDAVHVIERLRRPSLDLLENYCTNNENVEQFQKLVQQEKQK